MSPGDREWMRQQLLAQWQDGLAQGLMTAARLADEHHEPEIADEIRECLVHFVHNIARPLPVEAYEVV